MSNHAKDARPPGALTAADWRTIIARAPLHFEVISDSMKPTFSKGDRVRIRPLENGEPRVGQVVAFLNELIVTHRYLGDGRYRGDNTLTIDNDIERDAIVGIVAAVVRDDKEIPVPTKTRLELLLIGLRLKAATFMAAWKCL